MRRNNRLKLAVILVLSLMLILGACAKKTDEATVKPKESEYYTGTITKIQDGFLVLEGDQGKLRFDIDDDTTYDISGEEGVSENDIVNVKYYKDGDFNHAQEVKLVEHVHVEYSFKGLAVVYDEDSIIASSVTMTAAFVMDKDTKISGDLDAGDEIEITYVGDISKNPYATAVTVVKEKAKPETTIASGLVSELEDDTLLLSVDSAHAFRFKITKDTAIGGASNKLALGDIIKIVYKGELKETPTAVTITIIQTGKNYANTINGKIKKVGKDSITLKTDKKEYVFVTNADTKYSGEKPQKGYKAEITYTGDIADKPVAILVYSVKTDEEAAIEIKEAVIAEDVESNVPGKQEEAEAETVEPTDPTIEPEEAVTPEEVTPAGKEEAEPEKEAEPEEETEPEKEAEPEEETEPEKEAEPEGEAVEPAEEETVEPEEAVEPAEEEAAEPEGEAAEPAEEEGAEPEGEAVEPAEEAEEPEGEAVEPEEEAEAEKEAEESDKDKTDKDKVIFTIKGTISGGDEKKHTIEIQLEEDKVLVLKTNKKTEIAAGYIPLKGDSVEIKYDKKKKVLLSMKLVLREEDEKEAVKEAAAEAETKEETTGN